MYKIGTNNAQCWASHWQEQGQPWRTEPEIDAERQKFLAQQRAIPPDVARGQYPFKDVKLGRADIEWLLATHDQGHGPVDWHNERTGLDLRGADLRLADLRNLPLTRMLGSLPWPAWLPATPEQRAMARVHLEKALTSVALILKWPRSMAGTRARILKVPTSAAHTSKVPASTKPISKVPACIERTSK